MPPTAALHKGGQIKSWAGDCRDSTPTKLQVQNIQRALHVHVFTKKK